MVAHLGRPQFRKVDVVVIDGPPNVEVLRDECPFLSVPTTLWGLKLLLYRALSYYSMGPEATTLCGRKLLVYGSLSY